MQDFWFYLLEGWHHIISIDALDHQLFIAALAALYLWADWKKVLVLVTAFTIGHSLTLALSVLDIVRFPDHWVEFAIPVTIVLTALSNIIKPRTPESKIQWNYILALVFGLIHGMGFANTIRFMLAKDQSLATGLIGFNIGLEIGQIVVVAALLCVSWVFVKKIKLAHRDWIIILSSAVLGISLKMALERIPF